jgi:hypothetical protein
VTNDKGGLREGFFISLSLSSFSLSIFHLSSLSRLSFVTFSSAGAKRRTSPHLLICRLSRCSGQRCVSSKLRSGTTIITTRTEGVWNQLEKQRWPIAPWVPSENQPRSVGIDDSKEERSLPPPPRAGYRVGCWRRADLIFTLPRPLLTVPSVLACRAAAVKLIRMR